MSGAVLAVRIEVEPDFRWTVPCGFLVDPVPRGLGRDVRSSVRPPHAETGGAVVLAPPRKFVLPRLSVPVLPAPLSYFARMRTSTTRRQFLVVQLVAGFVVGFGLALVVERAGMTNVWQSVGLAPMVESGG